MIDSTLGDLRKCLTMSDFATTATVSTRLLRLLSGQSHSRWVFVAVVVKNFCYSAVVTLTSQAVERLEAAARERRKLPTDSAVKMDTGQRLLPLPRLA